jgi:hypothetical protein
VFVALGMIVILGIMGLAIDVGYYRYVARELQTAADAAALAGAMDITYNDQVAAGQAASGENGFSTTTPNVTVRINCATGCQGPITNSPYSAPGYPTYVQAIVTQANQPQFFSKIFGLHPLTLSASAVAAGGINCIYALDTASGGAISLTLAAIDSTCGVVDNSNLNGLLGSICAPSIQLKGSNDILGSFGCGGFRNSPPTKITTAVPDPLAAVAEPFVSNPPATCVTNTNVDTVAANNTTISQIPKYCYGTVITGKTGITINPGTYWGGGTNPAFKITNSTVTFLPGTYNIISQVVGQPGIQMTSTGFLGANVVTFGSGTYTVAGGIKDNGTFGSSVNWNNTAGSAALFILDGGGLTLTGNSGNGTGSVGTSSGGVTFYNTGTAGTGAVTSYGPIVSFFDFSGGFCGAQCQLSAPTTGTYAGILFFEDRVNTATSTCGFGGTAGACFTANFNFGGKIAHSGAYYFANSTVGFDFDFGNGAPYTLLVAKDINWFLSFTFNNNFANLPNGSPLRQGAAVLVQ